MPRPYNTNGRTQCIYLVLQYHHKTFLCISKTRDKVRLEIGGKCINIHDIINRGVSLNQVLIEVVEF